MDNETRQSSPVDQQQLLKALMGTFLEELDEHVCTLNDSLLAMEKEQDSQQRQELLQTLFRAVHSLKGAARAVDVQPVERLCHGLEDLLAGLRDRGQTPTGDLFSLLFQSADVLAESGRRLRDQLPLAEEPFQRLLDKVQPLLPGQPEASPPPAAASPPERAAEAGPAGHTVAGMGMSERPAGTPGNGQEARPFSPRIAGTMRVSGEKIDRLLVGTGELLVARQRLEMLPGELENLREQVGQWKAEWRSVEQALHTRAHRRGNGPRTAGRGPAIPALPPRVSKLLEGTGDRLRHLEKELERLGRETVSQVRQLNHVCGDLEGEVHRIRMVPFAEATAGLQRAVRDLVQGSGKQVALVIEGGDIEMDRSVLEGLSGALLHLVRNSVDHAIEPAEERREAGKPVPATITVSAALRGSQVDVVVQDDGRGLDLDRIREKTRQYHVEPADERELVRRIFLPGFSTATTVTDVSGRGIGLDVVKNRVEALHGTIEVFSATGRGTRFVLTVPLTLTTISALLVQVARQTFALATTNVRKLVCFGPGQIHCIRGRDSLQLDDAPLPVASLAQALGIAPAGPPANQQALAVVVAAGETRMVLVVDDVVTEGEVVVKNLGNRIRRLRYVAGATLLPDGQIALVLNASNVIRSALRLPPLRPLQEAAPPAKKRLLLAEDSVTTRSLIKSILETAGYEVLVAADGRDAWEQLQQQEVDLVVSDIEMPHWDGFTLTEAIRGASRISHLPVILVTSREAEPDQLRGMEVGADAYLVKSAFDQRRLLETIAQFL